MKRLKWLIELADTRPLLFSIALLLIGVGVLAVVVKDRESRIRELSFDKKVMENYYNKKIDSLNAYYLAREIKLQEEVKSTLNIIIDGYKFQLREQKDINDKIHNTLQYNQKMIDKNRERIKSLSND